jgi:Tfp pilus assembly protein PilF
VGIAYQSRQRFTDAMNAFKSAVAANPKFVEAWFHLGEVYQSMQSTDSARDAFQNCIKNAPADDSGQHWAQEAQKRLDTLH